MKGTNENPSNELIDDLMLMARVLTHNELKLYIYFRWKCNPVGTIDLKQMMGYLDARPAETVKAFNTLIDFKIIMSVDKNQYAIVSAPDWLGLEKRLTK